MNPGKKNTRKSRPAPGDASEGRGRPLLAYIRGVLPSLNRTERLIAELVLSDPERVISSGVAELSEASGASVGAIVNFCQKHGLKGLADFRIALARDLAQAGLPAGKAPHNGSTLERVFQEHTQSLKETLQINSQETFEQVVLAIEKARRIEFYAIGLSCPVAYTASCKLLLLGLSAIAQTDSHIQLIGATQLKAGDVAFGISLSGTTQETVQCLEVARAKGATTVCLTNAMKSPITTHSDFSLYATPSEVMYFQAPLASRITQLAVIDALFVSLALKHKNRTAGRLQQSAEELLKRRLR
jgi:RpiR family carbohydrate utilization transcriptional regulator